MVSAASAVTSATAATSARAAPDRAADFARAREFATVITDDTRPVGERLDAFNDFWRLTVAGRLYNATADDETMKNSVYKSTLMSEMTRLHTAWGAAQWEANEVGGEGLAAGLAYFDSLDEDEQAILFGAMNAPCYQDISKIGVDVPPQRFNGVAEWRVTIEATIDMNDLGRRVESGRASADEIELWDTVQTVKQTHESNRDGSWGREIKALLGVRPATVDRVDLSPAARQALTLLAPRPTETAVDLEKELPQTSAGIALQLLKGSMLDLSA